MRNAPSPQAGSRILSSDTCSGVRPSQSLPTVFRTIKLTMSAGV